MTTRKKFLEGLINIDEYYAIIANDSGVVADTSPKIMNMIKTALDSGDIHLNTIPLAKWDNMAKCIQRNNAVHAAFKNAGDYVTLSGLVCLLKHVYRVAALKHGKTIVPPKA